MIKLQVNRATKLFEQAAASLAKETDGLPDLPVFSYWCKFFGENPNELATSIKLIEPKVYNALESKAALNRLVEANGITDVFPLTYARIDKALAHKDQAAVWFVKPAHLSGGRGIQVVATKDLAGFSLPPHHIIQAGIEDIALIRGRKFTCRIYVLIWKGGLYLFDEGFVLVHAPAFCPGSTDYKVQVDHRGFQEDRADGVQMRPLTALNAGPHILDRGRAAVQKLRPVFSEALSASSPRRYILLGIDLLLLSGGDIRFIEINAIPNFVHSPRINQAVNLPLFTHVMRLVFGLGTARLENLQA